MTDPGPYSRIYWTVLDDKKFDTIRSDMRHFGAWSLMLVIADMAYPAPAFIPPTVSKASTKALVDAGLIDLLPARMYRIRGLKKEREQRSERGKAGATARWSGNATGMRTHSERTATGMLDETRRDEKETRQEVDEDEPTRAPDLGPSDEEKSIFQAIAEAGAHIRPESGMGQRVIRLIARRGVEAVGAELVRLVEQADGPMSDRQIVFGLEETLEPVRAAGRVEAPPVETGPSHGDRIYERMVARRMERFQQTGEWPDEWGERPGAAA